MWMHRHNQTSLFSHIALPPRVLCHPEHKLPGCYLLVERLAGSHGAPCVTLCSWNRTPAILQRLCLMHLYGAMQRSWTWQSGKRRPFSPASTTAVMMWRYTDVYQSHAERGHSGSTAQNKRRASAQWFKNKPLERSRILAMLQVPFSSTSEQQMDFFQQSHRLCITQTKGTEEFMVLTQASSDSELPFPILEPRPEPGRTESSFTPACTHTERECLASPKRVTVGLLWFQIKIVWWRYVYENIKYRKERQRKTHFPFYKAYLAFYKVYFPKWGMENCKDIESTQLDSVSLNVHSVQSLQRTAQHSAFCMCLQITSKTLRQEWCSLLAWKSQLSSVSQM